MSYQRFSYAPPTAGKHSVGIAGDFSSWEIISMEEKGGVHYLALELPPGVYQYKFVVDGSWILDENNPKKVPDGFGGYNSLLVVEPVTEVITWEDIMAELANKTPEKFYQFFRSKENSYELRFFWYPELSDAIYLLYNNQQIQLAHIGQTPLYEVFYCLFEHCGIFTFRLKIQYQNMFLFFGAEGFSEAEEDITPIEIELKAISIFSIPDWVGHSIIYQIFPDRFYNGNKDNDPDFREWYYEDCRTPPSSSKILSPEKEYYHMVDDWYDINGLKQSPWQKKGVPDFYSFYGGDIAGVKQKLDYLLDLGINVIYFNPLWQAKSNHKYDSADYHSIDPHFATTQEMIDFVKLAHEKGIRIILDVALNHTGETFWAFRDCVEKGPKSPYWNWYDWKKWPLPKPLPPDFNPKDYYQCWWGIKDMPDLNYDLALPHPEENAVRNIKEAHPNAALVDYLMSTVRWWLIDIGIDGFRLDVPDEVPFWFWELFRKEVKKAKPDAWIVGEIWYEARQWVSPLYFDSVMNYAFFKNPVIEFFILSLLNKEEFCRKIESGLALYPFHSLKAMMNLLGSHDTPRIFEISKGDVKRLKLAIAFQMCFIGAPHIYYGDEIAMEGGKDPDNRRPFNWNWENNPVACDLRNFYKELISIRKAHPTLCEGHFAFIPAPDKIIAFQRELKGEKILVFLNTEAESIAIDIPESSILLLGKIAERNYILPHSALILSELK